MGIHELCPGCMGRITEDQMHSGCPYCGYRLPESGGLAPHILTPHTVLEGKYMIGRTLGAGGCGITYLGYDLNLELRIAIKEYYPVGFVSRDTGESNMVISGEGEKGAFFSDGKKKYIQEARMLARFAGLRNIVSVRDYFEENNTCYIIMEYLDGETLKSYLARKGGRLSCEETMRMIQPLLASLNEVHSQGMIHRDISPDNIMILKDGTLKLLDFGSARDMAGNAERSASVMLKPGYAPEEQYRMYGEQGTWTDVYALCATIYRCLTGYTPVDALTRKEHDTLILPSQYGAALTPAQEAALLKGMAVDAAQRFKTVEEFYRGFYCNEIPVAQLVQSNGAHMGTASNMAQPTGSVSNMAQQMGAVPNMAQQTGSVPNMAQQIGSVPNMAQQMGAVPNTTQQTGTVPNAARQGMVSWGTTGQGMPQQAEAGPQNRLSYPEYQVSEHTSYVLQNGRRKQTRVPLIASLLTAAAVLVVLVVVWAFSGKREDSGKETVWSQGTLAGEDGGESSENGGLEDGSDLLQDDGSGSLQGSIQGGSSLPNGLTQNRQDDMPQSGIHGLSQSLDGDQSQQTGAPRMRYEIPEDFVEGGEGFYVAPDYPNDTSNINVMTSENDSITFQYTKESFCSMLELLYSEYYDVQVDVKCTEFTKTTINGYNALIIRIQYDLMGVALEQVQCAVETEKDKVTTITMSQPAGAGWSDAFERVLDSIYVD